MRMNFWSRNCKRTVLTRNCKTSLQRSNRSSLKLSHRIRPTVLSFRAVQALASHSACCIAYFICGESFQMAAGNTSFWLLQRSCSGCFRQIWCNGIRFQMSLIVRFRSCTKLCYFGMTPVFAIDSIILSFLKNISRTNICKRSIQKKRLKQSKQK